MRLLIRSLNRDLERPLDRSSGGKTPLDEKDIVVSAEMSFLVCFNFRSLQSINLLVSHSVSQSVS